MSTYFYLSMTPEALVASMLPPEEFGTYIAVGTEKRSREQAVFFALKPEFQSDYFDLSIAEKRCVPHPDGTPKHSVYLSIYRVLEHVPLEALDSLWIITRDGRGLELKQGAPPQPFEHTFHLYKELCPVHPLIASTLQTDEFCRFITDPSRPASLPKISFVDLALAGLSTDPAGGDAADLPYPRIAHLRDCLVQLQKDPDKRTKTVDRVASLELPLRCVRSGFYVGSHEALLHYPMLSREELDAKHHEWWRSANV